MKRIQRWISAFLVICLIAAMVPVTVSAASSGTCGESLTWTLSDDGVLTISGTGSMDDYERTVHTPWGKQRFYIREIVIEDGITSIGAHAFDGCYNATTVSLGNNVTSIGNSAFESCESLAGVTIPDSVIAIGDRAFVDCQNLTNLTIGSGIANIGEEAFWNCNSLTELIIPNNVITIGRGAFLSCDNLASVTIGNGLTVINENTFSGCSKLNSVSLGTNVHTISDFAFSQCSCLTNLVFPASVAYIGNEVFNICNNLAELYFSGNAPFFEGSAFWREVTLTAYYPAGNDTWTSDVMQDYEGHITWVPMGAKPDAPQVSASNVASSGKIKLTWDTVEDATEYKVYRATSKTGEYKLMKTTTGTSYTNTSTTAGKTYYYYVVAVDKDGTQSDKSNIVSRACDLPRPDMTLTNVESSGKIKVSWKAVDGAKEYQVYRATAKDGEYKLMKTTTGTSYTNTSAKAGTAYYYKVIAVHEKSTANSAYSVARSRTCDLPQPEITMSNVASTGKIKVSWEPVNGAKEYKVYYSDSWDGIFRLMKTTSDTSYINETAKPGKVYYYKVRAIAADSAANSAYSNTDCCTGDLPQPIVSITLSSGKPKVSWKEIDGAVSYKVYRATSRNGDYKLIKTTTNLSCTNTSAVAGTTYYYKVVAVASKAVANSAYSSIVSIKSK